jgi:hypothetical protein
MSGAAAASTYLVEHFTLFLIDGFFALLSSNLINLSHLCSPVGTKFFLMMLKKGCNDFV